MRRHSLLFINVCLYILVSSHSNQKIRLYDIIRKSLNRETGTLLLKILVHERTLRMTTVSSTIDVQTPLPTTEEDLSREPRVSWDSNEDHYFQWAFSNRRPMEPLPGRK